MKRDNKSKKHKIQVKKLQVIKAMSFNRLVKQKEEAKRLQCLKALQLLFKKKMMGFYYGFKREVSKSSIGLERKKISLLIGSIERISLKPAICAIQTKARENSILNRVFAKFAQRESDRLRVVLIKFCFATHHLKQHGWIIGNFVSL